MTDLAALEAETRALLASDRVTEPTRRALLGRLDRRFGAPRTFSPARMATLEAVCLRLLPEPALVERIGLAHALDDLLAEGPGDGWRYRDLPADAELHPKGLQALDRAASAGFGRVFGELDESDQDRLLAGVQAGEPIDGVSFDTKRWFEELLSALVELYYGHPLVQRSMGYGGMADALGWQAIGLADVAAEAHASG